MSEQSEEKPAAVVSREPILSIILGKRLRPVDEDYALSLANSMSQRGLDIPIKVRQRKNSLILVSGAYRLRAAVILGWHEIDCIISVQSELEARLEEVEENLIRRELAALERAIFLAERDAIHKEMHPETKHGGDRVSAEAEGKSQSLRLACFTKTAADKTVLSERTIQDAIALIKNLDPSVVEQLKGTETAKNGAQLRALSKLGADDQKACVESLSNGSHTSVKDWRVAVGDLPEKDKPTHPDDVWWEKMLVLWEQKQLDSGAWESVVDFAQSAQMSEITSHTMSGGHIVEFGGPTGLTHPNVTSYNGTHRLMQKLAISHLIADGFDFPDPTINPTVRRHPTNAKIAYIDIYLPNGGDLSTIAERQGVIPPKISGVQK